MTKTQEHQWLSAQLGMEPKAYVSWGLSLVRRQKELPTQVGVGGSAGSGSLSPLALSRRKKQKGFMLCSHCGLRRITDAWRRADGNVGVAFCRSCQSDLEIQDGKGNFNMKHPDDNFGENWESA